MILGWPWVVVDQALVLEPWLVVLVPIDLSHPINLGVYAAAMAIGGALGVGGAMEHYQAGKQVCGSG